MNVVNVVPMHLPPPPPRPRGEQHVSVLGREVLAALSPVSEGVYVDATLGAGGHTATILETPGARVIGIDRDERALAIARARLARAGDRVTYVHGEFSEIERHLAALGVPQVDGLLADIGVSSMQLDDPGRGMSFRAEGPLDMRMDSSRGETALELIERLSDEELADLIYRYGEERRSRRVARCIKQAADSGELVTTLDLRRAVVRAVGPARIGGVDPATRTFQALRIAVNGELDQLEALLEAAPRIIAPGGVLAVISFHSLEDRIVKRALREPEVWEPLTKKPVTAGDDEVEGNPRARSAKLRAARRVGGAEALA
ncbi:16S rRNA (cytosine(1402)-N(4))-methyltransferase RsmH [Sorangium sp. So ce145]|uniref:Ribosomal RNA small subunit methyltransferase H n=2 Tax=Sorangium cellulosum TaxID=56 RepID=RSMH_SORC5|nr:RecName: Full=Ribosomal RNA small subunit methyltransferase H; AltName: Full=16S rRNA m(4)C1402 methyltransferase; AltName: Full=rRNA (cytosine-N(4)-)-methyltransferase RsmH [Sorangium cellulosum So ce56]CAN91815.1 methyltransferase [Sorangium cellulosum So ce56]